MRILVTGAGGFVGTHLCHALSRRAPAAEVMKLMGLHEPAGSLFAADLLDRSALDAAVAAARPDVTVHLAAQASVSRGNQDGGDTWAVNVTGSINLATAIARHAPESTLLFASSSEVYGASFLRGPATETTPTLPMSAYARSKRIAEDCFDAILPANGRLVVVRPFNHSGPGQREDFVLPSFAAQAARIEAGRQPPEIRVGNLDVVRDFLDVRDVVAAYVALIERAESLPRRFLCNIASGRPRALREIVELLRSLARHPFEIVVDPERVRPVDIPVAVGDATLLRSTIGWKPETSIEVLLRSLLQACRQHVGEA